MNEIEMKMLSVPRSSLWIAGEVSDYAFEFACHSVPRCLMHSIVREVLFWSLRVCEVSGVNSC